MFGRKKQPLMQPIADAISEKRKGFTPGTVAVIAGGSLLLGLLIARGRK